MVDVLSWLANPYAVALIAAGAVTWFMYEEYGPRIRRWARRSL